MIVRPVRFRRVAAVAAVALAATVGAVAYGSAPALAAGTGTICSGCSVNERSGPSTGYGIVGSAGGGQTVTITCTTRGQWVNGPWGPSNLWDDVGGNHFVADALVYTGTSNPVAGDCGRGDKGDNVNPFAYPWPAVDSWVADGHGYYEGECVSLAAWAVAASGRAWPNWLGNADMWHGANGSESTPHVGDVAQWDDNHNGAGGAGHVAYVAAVFGDGTIQIDEYNWGTFHRYNSRRISAGTPSRYLKF